MQTVSDTTIQDFLRQFDGDTESAIAAIRAADGSSTRTGAKAANNRPESTAPVIIEATNIVKTYKIGRQEVRALNGVSLRVHEGEFVAITGSSGSGKSTLLQLLGGLDKPSGGTVRVNGHELAGMKDRQLADFRSQTIGFVFQFFYLQPFLSVRRNLEVPGMFSGHRHTERLKRIEDLAEAVGLSDRLAHLPKELSGGQMQRVAIARALMNKPQILLADEPTGNLDSKNGGAIIDMFEKIRTQFGTTIVLVTHDHTAASRADRVISMKDGVTV
jgi:ABC-type lipoprotein export system ATPase subunit